MLEITSVAALRGRIGEEIAVSEWIDVTQARIDQFAEATDDRQWIHVNPERATAESPFGTSIAHGFLTLSLLTTLAHGAMTVAGLAMAVNYGLNRVRFIAPVPAGSRVRGHFTPAALDEIRGGVQVTWKVTIEREGEDRPCCVAEWLVRYYGAITRA